LASAKTSKSLFSIYVSYSLKLWRTGHATAGRHGEKHPSTGSG
jgi:hypothetical protein